MEYKQMRNPCADCDPSDSCKNCQFGAYKTTGLEPEKIVDLMGAHGMAISDLAEYRALGDIDHIRDLLAAHKDGRLVVAPCKVEQLRKMLDDLTSGSSVGAGETYATGYLYGWKNGRAELLRYIFGMSDGGTRESAETALRGEEHG